MEFSGGELAFVEDIASPFIPDLLSKSVICLELLLSTSISAEVIFGLQIMIEGGMTAKLLSFFKIPGHPSQQLNVQKIITKQNKANEQHFIIIIDDPCI
jgi:hypothetical protein